VTEGDLTGKQRDVLIAEMSDEVGALVVQDSYRLARALTVAELNAERHLGWYRRLMDELEQKGLLERALEVLPDDATLAERKAAGRGLTRPELAVLSAYAKMDLYAEVLRSDMPDDPYLIGVLERYFPEPLRKRFQKEILGHRLRREIIATVATNSMVNRVGSTFGLRMRELSGMPLPAIAKAYMAAATSSRCGGSGTSWTRPRRGSRAARAIVVRETQTLIERGTRWLLHRSPEPFEITDLVARFLAAVEALSAVLSGLPCAAPASDATGLDAEWFRQEGVGRGSPPGWPVSGASSARSISASSRSGRGSTWPWPAGSTSRSSGASLSTRCASGSVRGRRISGKSGRAPIWRMSWGPWARRSPPPHSRAKRIRSDSTMVPKTVVERWAGSHGAAIERYDRLMDELTALEAPGFPMLTVALGEYASWRGVRWRAEAFIPHRMRRLPFNFPLVRAARSKSDVHSLRQRRLRARR